MKGTEDTYQVSASLAELVSKGLDYSVLSEGAFDIAIEPLTSLWNFTAEKSKKVPKDSLIQAALPKCNYHNISVDTDKNEITLKTDDTAIELGAIAKGYIADRLKDYLVSQDVKVRSSILAEMFSVLAKKQTILLLRSGSRNHLQTEAKLLLLWTSGISQWFPQEFMRDALNRMALCIITCSILKPAILMITG